MNSTPDSPGAPTRFRPVSKPAPTLSDLDRELPTPEELATLLPRETYLIEGFLGQGGMGAVYKAIQISLNRTVAIKLMPLALGVEFDFADRFRREAQSMAALNHPGIVGVIDFGTAGNYLYIVMEYVDGSDLHAVLKAGQMTPELALWLMPSICDAVATAHEQGIIHRDLKPANIMLTRDWRVKVADFGLAKRSGSIDSLVTQPHLGIGTPDYAAPEQFDSTTPADHRADIYALGVTFYQMLTGQLPGRAWTPPSALVGTDPRLDPVIVKAMRPRMEDRFQTVREMQQGLVNVQQALAWEHQQQIAAAQVAQTPEPARIEPQPTSAAPVPQSRQPAPPQRLSPSAAPQAATSPTALIVGIAATLLVLGLGGWLLTRRSKSEPPSPPAAEPIATTLPSPAKASPKPTPAPPPSSKPTPYIADNTGWTEVDLKTVPMESNTERLADGTLHLKGTLSVAAPMTADSAVRARFRGQTKGLNRRVVLHSTGSKFIMANITSIGNRGELAIQDGNVSELRSLGSFDQPPRNAPFTLEFRVKGDEYTVLIDGKQVAQARDSTLTSGKMGVFADDGILESLHYQVGTESAVPPAFTGQVKPAKLPDPSKWQPAFTAAQLTNGGIRVTGNSLNGPANAVFKDGAVRYRIIYSEYRNSMVRLRVADGWFYQFQFHSDGGAMSINRIAPGNAENKTRLLGQFPVPKHEPTDSVQVTALVVGSVLAVYMDEKPMIAVEDSELKQGGFSIYSNDSVFRDVEWQSLDPDGSKPTPTLAKMPDPSRWKPVFPAAFLKDGYLAMQSGASAAVPPDVRFADGALRFTVEAKDLVPGMLARIRASGGSSASGYQVQLNPRSCEIRRVATATDSKILQPSAPYVASDDSTEMTLVAVGKVIAVFANGTQIAALEDDALATGSIYLWSPIATRISKIEWQSLDPIEQRPKTAAELQLEALAAEYQAEFDKLGGLPFKTALDTLNAQFATALDRAVLQSQQQAQLDDVLALQSESKRMKEAPSMPELDDDGTPAVLKPLRDTYRKSLAKLTADRDARTKPALERHEKRLKAYQAQLTKAGDIDGAVQVKDFLTRLSRGEGTVPVTSTPGAASTTKLKMGKLHGWGEQKSQPIDMSEGAKYDDFIQVIGKEGWWYALRANGTVVTNCPTGFIPDMKHKVTALHMCGPHIIALGPKQFTLRSNHLGNETVEAAEWGGGPLKDVVLANGGVWLALREDGTLRMRDMKKQKGRPAIQPNQAAKLTRDVTSVVQAAAGGTCLLVVTKDGKAHAWNTPNRSQRDSQAVGETTVVDCSALPANIQRVWGSGGGGGVSATFHILTADGTLKRFTISLAANKWEEETASYMPPPGSVADIATNAHSLIATLKSGEKLLLTSAAELGAIVKQNSNAIDIFAQVLTHDDTKLGRVKSNFVLWIE